MYYLFLPTSVEITEILSYTLASVVAFWPTSESTAPCLWSGGTAMLQTALCTIHVTDMQGTIGAHKLLAGRRACKFGVKR